MKTFKIGTVVTILRAGGLPVGSTAVVRGTKKGYEGAIQVSATEDSTKFFYEPRELGTIG